MSNQIIYEKFPGDPLRFCWNFVIMICNVRNEHTRKISDIFHVVFEIWPVEIWWKQAFSLTWVAKNEFCEIFWLWKLINQPSYQVESSNCVFWVTFCQMSWICTLIECISLDFYSGSPKAGTLYSQKCFSGFLRWSCADMRGLMNPIFHKYCIWVIVYTHKQLWSHQCIKKWHRPKVGSSQKNVEKTLSVLTPVDHLKYYLKFTPVKRVLHQPYSKFQPWHWLINHVVSELLH